VVEALLHISAQCTFLLRAPVSLANVRAADGGERIVLTGLEFGEEFPEIAGRDDAMNESSKTAPDNVRDCTTCSAGVQTTRTADSVEVYDLQAERDAYLVRDAVAIINELLPSTAEEAAAAVAALRGEAGIDLRALPELRSKELRALCNAATGRHLPTLRQLLSHPYFEPLTTSEKLAVEPQYQRWREVGAHRQAASA